MKKSRYYPFERNRYFYGKLLTVRDFESEQKYFNDKRRLLNRLLYGTGVVTGLQVVAIDDKSVSVEMGAAFDALGREIIVPSPVTLKLSMADGFTNNEYAKNVYLCIAYDEKGKEPVHAVANSSVRSEEISEYNRVLESYRLFVREEAPDPSSFPYGGLFEETNVLVADGPVRLLLTTPRYVNPGQLFEARLTVEKTLQTPPVSLQFELSASQLEAASDEYAHIAFREPADSQETEYSIPLLLRAGSGSNVKAIVGLAGQLRIGDRQVSVEPSSANTVFVTEGPVQKRLLDDYYNRTIDQAMDAPSEPCIYLAKISLLQMGPTYMIEKVERVPFGEYVTNASVLQRIGELEQRAEAVARQFEESTAYAQAQRELTEREAAASGKSAWTAETKPAAFIGQAGADETRSGVVEIELRNVARQGMLSFSKQGKSFFSGEIEHGLGEGNVYVTAGLENNSAEPFGDMVNDSEQVYYGNIDVFKDSAYAPDLDNVTVGALVYPKKGTLRIGVKVLGPTDATRVRVRWWAMKKPLEAGALRNGANELSDSRLEAAASIEE
ncbi:hypothetical protein [Paenibacillus sp. MBLB4367]|uniref:hypothetical protein n=1 Tax=Paenibacillus sp. MBLB4367 TaxID=3384767 RepID=UPI0039080947